MRPLKSIQRDEERAQDLILRRFITYRLANAIEPRGNPMWCYCAGKSFKRVGRGQPGGMLGTEKQRVTRSLGLLGTVLVYVCFPSTVFIKKVLGCWLVT